MPTHIYFGADHGGFTLKNELIEELESRGFLVTDCGARTLEEGDDYPEFAFSVSKKVAEATQEAEPAFGILLCRSGVGMAIAANKVTGIRAATIHTREEAIHAREHDGINVISLPADELDALQAKSIIEAFLGTPVSSEERHQRRIAAISRFETEKL